MAESRRSSGPGGIGGWRSSVFIAFGLALNLLGGCTTDKADIGELSGRTMGTTFSVQLTPNPTPNEQQKLEVAIKQRLDEINAVMSTYLPGSAITRFNNSESTAWQSQPAELVTLVAQARAISEATGGRYDVTVGPLVELWGFGASGRRDAPPDATAISSAAARVGYQGLDSRTEPPALRKAWPELEVDLSSIAKGWAVDEIARLLDRHGFHDYLVEIGGELVAKGHKAAGKPWRVAVERPVARYRTVQRVIPISGLAMASSGDYRNFFDADGERYSHTIDPLTGNSVRHRLAAVSVFAGTCTEADAWATALMSMGDEQGPALAESLGLKALFLIRQDGDIQERVSSALKGAPFWSASQVP